MPPRRPRTATSDESSASEYELSTDGGSDSGESASEFLPSEVEEAPRRRGRKPRHVISVPPPPAATDNAPTPATAAAASATPPSTSNANGGITSSRPKTASQSPPAARADAAATTAPAAAPATPGAAAAAASSSSRGFICDHPGCTKSFSKVGKLNRHKLSHSGAREFACTHPGCGKQFARNDRLRRHWKIHQNEAVRTATAQPAARTRPKIGGAFDGDDSIGDVGGPDAAAERRSGEESLGDWYSGSDVELSIVPTAILRSADPSKSGSSAAGSVLVVPSPAAAASALPPVLPPLVKFACSHAGCGLSFLLREHLKRHESTVHTEKPHGLARKGPVPGSKRDYPCTHIGCFQTFDKAHKLREHAFIHTGVLPWICQMPLESHSHSHSHSHSSSSKKHSRHESGEEEDEDGEMVDDEGEDVESGKRDNASVASDIPASTTTATATTFAVSSGAAAASSLCQEGFMSRALLLKHQRLAHGPDRFLCAKDGCGQTFTRFLELRKHRAVEHPVAHARELACPTCGLVAPTRTQATLHAQTHLSATEREQLLLTCPFDGCDKKFTRRGNLNTHIRGHHDATWKGKGPTAAAAAADADGTAADTKKKKKKKAKHKKMKKADDGDDDDDDEDLDDDDVDDMSVSDGGGSSDASSSSLGPLVVRYPCPFPVCAARMARRAYKFKNTLQRHLVQAHDLTPTEAKDIDAIARAVETRGDAPLPQHHNTRRIISTRDQITRARTGRSKRARINDATEDVVELESAVTAAAAAATAAGDKPAPIEVDAVEEKSGVAVEQQRQVDSIMAPSLPGAATAVEAAVEPPSVAAPSATSATPELDSDQPSAKRARTDDALTIVGATTEPTQSTVVDASSTSAPRTTAVTADLHSDQAQPSSAPAPTPAPATASIALLSTSS